MSAILPYRNCFYKWTKYNSKQSHDTTAILISLWCALRLDQLFSTIYEKLNIWHFYEVSVVRLWWTSENHVSRYLFLEQIAHFLEGVLTFLRKAGDLIQRFSESTHIDVLNKACKMMKVRKKLNSFSSSGQDVCGDSSGQPRSVSRSSAGDNSHHTTSLPAPPSRDHAPPVFRQKLGTSGDSELWWPSA